MAEQIVAILESEPDVRTRIENLLRDEGYHVVSLESAAGLLEFARTHAVDAFLVGVDLPGEDGPGLCRKIRELDMHAQTPILCLTGIENLEAIHRALNSGADDFIPKPVNLPVLHARVRIQIQKRGHVGKLERKGQMLQRYLSPRVASIAEEFSITGHLPPPTERQVALCMTDIRGFTALSETMDPVKLFSLLSSHLRDQIELVYHHGGYVDKFNGDGLLAVFDGDAMVEQCCLCALDIMDLTTARSGGKEKFPIGIGVHTGRVVIGNIGSVEHLDYSVVGMSVNLTARLCGYAQPETIIVSETVREAIAADPRLQCVDRREVQIRGVSDPVTIHRLVPSRAGVRSSATH
jgi:class 3 adenylate cyclase/ActR/RegA family two-component response regulator